MKQWTIGVKLILRCLGDNGRSISSTILDRRVGTNSQEPKYINDADLRGKWLDGHHLKLMADQGGDTAQYRDGVCIDKGPGVPVDESLAAQYYRLAYGNATLLLELIIVNLL
jgi:hypothetical protein